MRACLQFVVDSVRTAGKRVFVTEAFRKFPGIDRAAPS